MAKRRCVHIPAHPTHPSHSVYSKYVGNDLSTPRPEFEFPGLQPGDAWCLCASRFLQAHDEGCAPNVHLGATHRRALEVIPLDILEAYALD